MGRHKQSRKSKKVATKKKKAPGRKPAAAYQGPAHLVVIDQTPIVKQWLSTCRRLRNELHKKQELLREFEEVKVPAYAQWVNATFGAELTKIRDLEKARADWAMIEYHLSNCASQLPHRYVEVYDELMERKANGTLSEFVPPPFRPGDPDAEDDLGRDDDEDEDEYEDEDEDGYDDDDFESDFEEDFRDFAKKIFDRLFGDGEEDPDVEEAMPRGEGRPLSAAQQSNEAAMKLLYRSLAKRLHPDRSGMEEGLRNRRWYELQEAYEKRDLAALERIEAVCDMDTHGLTMKLGIAQLKEIAAYHKRHLPPLRAALRGAKRDPAFQFDLKNTAQAERRERARLREVIEDLEEVIACHEDSAAEDREQIEAWLESVKPQPPRPEEEIPLDDLFLTPEKLEREERERAERNARKQAKGKR